MIAIFLCGCISILIACIAYLINELLNARRELTLCEQHKQALCVLNSETGKALKDMIERYHTLFKFSDTSQSMWNYGDVGGVLKDFEAYHPLLVEKSE